MPDQDTPPAKSTNDTSPSAPASVGDAPGAPEVPPAPSPDVAEAEQDGDGDGDGGREAFSWPVAPKAQDDVGGFFEHETVKPHLEERLAVAREEGEQATLKRLHSFEETRTQNYQAVTDFTSTFLKGWQRIVKDAPNPEEMTEFFDEHPSEFAALSGVHWQQGAAFGGSAILNDLARAAGVSDEDLTPINESMKYALREQLSGRDGDMSFSERFLKLVTKAAVDKAVKDAEQRLTKLADTQDKRRDRKEERENGAQAADVGGRGSGTPRRYTRDQLRKMTREELANVPSEERDRALAASY